jgi:hypothetical protein
VRSRRRVGRDGSTRNGGGRRDDEVETTPPDVRAPNRLALARFGEVQLIAQAADGDLSPGDTVRFEWSHRLRESPDQTDPRLVAVDDS